MALEHPVIESIERTGFPVDLSEADHYGLDALGNEVFVGDDIYVFEEEFFLKETLLQETKETLQILGAEEMKA
ncbi:hypothetical protein [Halobacillus sp. BAB-2008]|uniref:hypothetical protein n=1 Tax=Halobacillus sp. BAB-2008 TaxID=1246484 RepID=UPI0002A4DC3A|nr:hypothetical protein [Halobacillus sp. BAB-2008]ELK47212.1 hypothetical protein D479_07162 [Halobacillus sp. BAB-2008]